MLTRVGRYGGCLCAYASVAPDVARDGGGAAEAEIQAGRWRSRLHLVSIGGEGRLLARSCGRDRRPHCFRRAIGFGLHVGRDDGRRRQRRAHFLRKA